jgi:tetratricopeptide (TPR) repeat protein
LALIFLALAFFSRRKNPALTLSVLWFFLGLLPTSLIPLNVIASENRLYLPSLAAIWILAWMSAISNPQSSLPHPPSAIPRNYSAQVLLLAIAVFFSLLSCLRHPVWQSTKILWRDAVEKAPGLARSHVNYGIELRMAGWTGKAIRQYWWALRLDPYDSRAYSNLANAYHDLGRLEEEEAALRQSLKLDPGNVVALRNLAYLLSEQGRNEETLAVLAAAVKLAPRRADLRRDLGLLYLRLGERAAGARELKASLRLDPNQPDLRAALEPIELRQLPPE